MIRFIIITLLLFGCSNDSAESGHCYLVSGLYLLGDDWPAVGYVEDVFDTYNTDSDLEYFYEKNPSIKQLWKYQDKGCRVVIGYPSDGLGGYHYRPMEHHENITPDSAYVSGHFSDE